MTHGQPLPEMQEAFAQAVARGVPGAQAYLNAGYSAKDRKMAGTAAWRLTKRPEVAQRLAELSGGQSAAPNLPPASTSPTLEQAMIAMMQAQTALIQAMAMQMKMQLTAVMVAPASVPTPAPLKPPPVEFDPLPVGQKPARRRSLTPDELRSKTMSAMIDIGIENPARLLITPTQAAEQAAEMQTWQDQRLADDGYEEPQQRPADFGLGALRQEYGDILAEEDEPPAPPSDIDVWVRRLQTYQETKMWMPDWGPLPGQPGYQGVGR